VTEKEAKNTHFAVSISGSQKVWFGRAGECKSIKVQAWKRGEMKSENRMGRLGAPLKKRGWALGKTQRSKRDSSLRVLRSE
jgi:hypothetical protein